VKFACIKKDPDCRQRVEKFILLVELLVELFTQFTFSFLLFNLKRKKEKLNHERSSKKNKLNILSIYTCAMP